MGKNDEAFSKDDLDRALAMLITNASFLKAYLPLLDAETVPQAEFRWLFKALPEYVEKFDTAPGFTIVRSLLKTDNRLTEDQKEFISLCVERMEATKPRKTDFKYYGDVLERYLRRCFVKDILKKAKGLVDRNEMEDAEDLLLDMKVPSATKDDVYFIPYDWEVVLREDEGVELDRLVSTGLPTLDSYLAGGIRPGELCVVLAPTAYGKSMMLVQIGAEAMNAGKKVIHFSFENSVEETMARYMSNLTNVPREEFPAFRKALGQLVETSEETGGVVAVERLLGSATDVHVLESAIISLSNQYEFDPDLIIVDYGDLMRPVHFSNKKYENQQTVFEELRDLGTQFDVPLVTATQSNREGLKSKRVRLTHIADSLGKAMTADIVLAISRPDKEEQIDVDVRDILGGTEAEITLAKFRRGDDSKMPVKVITKFDVAKFVEEDDTQDAKQDIQDQIALKRNKEKKRVAARKAK